MHSRVPQWFKDGISFASMTVMGFSFCMLMILSGTQQGETTQGALRFIIDNAYFLLAMATMLAFYVGVRLSPTDHHFPQEKLPPATDKEKPIEIKPMKVEVAIQPPASPPPTPQPQPLPTTSAPETQKVQEQTSAKRVYTNWTAKKIVESIKGLTDLEVSNTSRPHIDKWLKIEGVVENVVEIQDTVVAYVPEGILSFKKTRWKSDLETLRIGDTLKAEGKIKEISRFFNITMEKCEVIEIRPK